MLIAIARWTFLITAILLAAHVVREHRLNNESDYLFRSVGLTVLAFFFAALVALGVTRLPGVLHRLATHRVLVFLGVYSYGIYIFHRPLVWPLVRLAGPERLGRMLHYQPAGDVLSLLIAIAVTVAVAYVSWHLFEKQFLKLKRYFAYQAPVVPMPPN